MNRPLLTLDELWQFRPLPAHNVPAITMPAVQDLSRPKLLVCHDYKGVYAEGECNTREAVSTAYVINHWALIDTFVYFSHHLVTIPPAQWVVVAHLNGTQVLGTFIAENDDGAAVCARAFASSSAALRSAIQLAAVAAAGGFEGWLINIEVELDASLIPHVIVFLTELTTLMRRQAGAASLVIWYDAVTKDGDLNWQNTLNSKNDCFLTACDGLFTNYGWKAESPRRATAAAGRRKADVYFGTDVYGRGTFGGGGLNSGEAVAAAQSQGFSAALFAPGWVCEEEHCDGMSVQQRQEIFWGKIADSLGALRPPSASSCFHSNFDQGCGLSVFRQGTCSSDAPWFDLSKAKMQPCSLRKRAALMPAGQSNALTAEVTMTCAFDGGSCLTIKGSFLDGSSQYVPLFDTDLRIYKEGPGKVKCLHIQWTT